MPPPQENAAGGESKAAGQQQERATNLQSIFRRPEKFKLGDDFDLFWRKTLLYFEAIDLKEDKKKRLALLFNLTEDAFRVAELINMQDGAGALKLGERFYHRSLRKTPLLRRNDITLPKECKILEKVLTILLLV